MNLELVVEAHCAAGVATHEQCGQVIPKFWAQGEHLRAVAEPASREALAITASTGVTMLSLLCHVSDARYVGRTAEAWTRNITDGTRIDPGSLAAMADSDPEVKTAIVTQGYDLFAGKGYTSIRTFSLDDDAQPRWDAKSEAGELDSWFRFCEAVRTLMTETHEQFDHAVVNAFVESCGWRLWVFA